MRQMEEDDGLQLTVDGFNGSLQQFVELVGKRQIAVTELCLADVVRQCLDRLAAPARIDLEAAGEALVLLSRLTILKSAALLAQPEGQEGSEESDRSAAPHEDRRELFRAAGPLLRAREGLESFTAVPRAAKIERVVEPRDPGELRRAWDGIVKRAGLVPLRLAVPSFVCLETAVSALVRTLAASGRLSFRHFSRGADRGDTVTHFLAVLELMRRGKVTAVQTDLFGDIEIEAVARDVDIAARAG
jgi:chromatin segregation and condensation protein Rec8/ScpA/Scc1 (kleisin family)